MAMQDRKQQYFQCATELLKSGTRPSADMLVHACGGSKSTALAALNDFWETYVPDILAGAGELDQRIPFPVREAANALWVAATTAASTEAQAIFSRISVDLAIQTEIAEKAKADLLAAQNTIAPLQEEMVRANGRALALSNKLATSQEEANALRVLHEETSALVSDLRSELSQCRAEQASERAQAAESIRVVTAALEDAHARASSQLRSENTLLRSRLDAMREERDRALALGQSASARTPYRARLRNVRRVKVKSA